MDRSVLLVLLCLQVFLLISTFTSTDVAAMVTDDQQQQQFIDLVRELLKKQQGSNCSGRSGGCTLLPKPPRKNGNPKGILNTREKDLQFPPTPNPRLLALDKIIDQKKMKQARQQK